VFGELVWLQDGSRYDGRLTLKAVFFTLLNWHSTGKIGPSGIEPERYSESRKAEVASHFVRDQGQIIFSNNAPPVPLQPGAQDRMSVMMQLGGLLAARPERYPAGTRISVQTVGVRDADVWVFVVGDEEKLQLPAGEYTARKLTRNPRKEFDGNWNSGWRRGTATCRSASSKPRQTAISPTPNCANPTRGARQLRQKDSHAKTFGDNAS
jgi:hypothetical protein